MHLQPADYDILAEAFEAFCQKLCPPIIVPYGTIIGGGGGGGIKEWP